MSQDQLPRRYRAPGFKAGLPPGGIKSALPGGNTVGGWIREAEPRKDGYRHVDTPAMIELLQRIGANHYFFGIWDSPTDFDDLRLEFAPAAQAAGIQLLPYIVPPTETYSWGRASRPYVMDYLAWAKALAELSLEYPVLTGWAIDDFDCGDNPAVFTPEYLAEIRETQFAINPDLGFFTCAYYGSATSDEFMIKYGPYIDGIIYPYLDGPNINTIVADRVRQDITEINEVARRHDVGLIFLVYTGRFLDGVLAPTAEYAGACVSQAVQAAAEGETFGVVSYGLQVDGAPTVANERRSMYGDGRGALVASHAGIKAGDYAELSTKITIDPDSPRYELSFWHSRALQLWRIPQRGDFRILVLVDGAQVWAADVHDATWQQLWVQGLDPQGQFDVTSAMIDKTEATLSFRLTALRDVSGRSVDVGVDHLETIGFTMADPGFEDASAWQVSSSGGPIVGLVDVFVPDRPEQIIEAVATAYRQQPQD
ncbi:hypothetical protein [Microlunatus sp. GCM10028923]|uniref:hypothetical protein n=1 Tax=Microlunatus sp. GCM10028923 TaxID=3273400 RepID=UPI0036234BBF